MITRSGSQIAEDIESAGYEVIATIGHTGAGKRGYVLWNHDDDTQELWYANEHYAGYVLRYENTNLEFAYTIKDWI